MSLHSRSFIKGCCLSSGSLSPLLMDWILEFIVGAGYLLFAPLDPLSTIHLFCALGNWPGKPQLGSVNRRLVHRRKNLFLWLSLCPDAMLFSSGPVLWGYLWLSFLGSKTFFSLLSFSGIGVIIALLLLVSFNPTYTFITSSFIKLSSFLAWVWHVPPTTTTSWDLDWYSE